MHIVPIGKFNSYTENMGKKNLVLKKLQKFYCNSTKVFILNF